MDPIKKYPPRSSRHAASGDTNPPSRPAGGPNSGRRPYIGDSPSVGFPRVPPGATYPDGTTLIGFGEDVVSPAVNRALYELHKNVDSLGERPRYNLKRLSLLVGYPSAETELELENATSWGPLGNDKLFYLGSPEFTFPVSDKLMAFLQPDTCFIMRDVNLQPCMIVNVMSESGGGSLYPIAIPAPGYFPNGKAGRLSAIDPADGRKIQLDALDTGGPDTEDMSVEYLCLVNYSLATRKGQDRVSEIWRAFAIVLVHTAGPGLWATLNHDINLLAPRTTLLAVDYGTLQFDNLTRKIIRTVGTWDDATPEADDYSAPGTRVKIAGSALNDGTYTVVGLGPTNQELVVAEPLVAEGPTTAPTVDGADPWKLGDVIYLTRVALAPTLLLSGLTRPEQGAVIVSPGYDRVENGEDSGSLSGLPLTRATDHTPCVEVYIPDTLDAIVSPYAWHHSSSMFHADLERNLPYVKAGFTVLDVTDTALADQKPGIAFMHGTVLHFASPGTNTRIHRNPVDNEFTSVGGFPAALRLVTGGRWWRDPSNQYTSIMSRVDMVEVYEKTGGSLGRKVGLWFVDYPDFRTPLSNADYGTLQFFAGTNKIVRTDGRWDLPLPDKDYSIANTRIYISGSEFNDGFFTVVGLGAGPTELVVAEALVNEDPSILEVINGCLPDVTVFDLMGRTGGADLPANGYLRVVRPVFVQSSSIKGIDTSIPGGLKLIGTTGPFVGGIPPLTLFNGFADDLLYGYRKENDGNTFLVLQITEDGNIRTEGFVFAAGGIISAVNVTGVDFIFNPVKVFYRMVPLAAGIPGVLSRWKFDDLDGRWYLDLAGAATADDVVVFPVNLPDGATIKDFRFQYGIQGAAEPVAGYASGSLVKMIRVDDDWTTGLERNQIAATPFSTVNVTARSAVTKFRVFASGVLGEVVDNKLNSYWVIVKGAAEEDRDDVLHGIRLKYEWSAVTGV